MTGKNTIVSALAILFVLTGPAGASAQGLEWGGSLTVNSELSAGKSFDFPSGSFDSLGLDLLLHMEANPTEKVRVYAEASLTNLAMPVSISGIADLSSWQALNHVEARLGETYVDLYDFILPHVDIRLGRQRIAWGPAETIGIIDSLDPLDLENPLRFGKRIPSDALAVRVYLHPVKIEGVYIPVFRPSLLPLDASSLMPAAPIDLPSPLAAHAASLDVKLPAEDAAAQATLGARLGLALGSFDLAASYVYGRQSLPAVTRVAGSFFSVMPPLVDLAVTLEYPRQHLVGLDAAGEILGIGVWAEAAYAWPDLTLVTDMRAIGGELQSEDAEPYLKAVVGMDYTFPIDLYVNLQYAHGLFHEAAPEDLNDYLLLGLEWRMSGGFVKLGPVGVALEVDDLLDIEGSWAVVLNPELTVYPMDGVELAVGARWVEGKEATTFGSQKEANGIYARAKVSF